MKKGKLTFKFLSMLILCITMTCIVVMADVIIERTGTEYTTIEEAITEMQIDDVIKLLENVDLGAGSEYETGKYCGIIVRNGEELTIDLNGKEIKSAANHSAIYVEAGAKLTIKDSLGGGKITSKGSYCIRNYGELVIDGGEYTVVDGTDTAVESYVLFARTNSTTTINNGTFNGFIGTNGYETITKLTINNGTFNKMLYLPAAGEYEINGGTFEVENNEDNNAVIEVKRGKLTITDGTFKMNVETIVNDNETVIGNNGSGDYVGVIIVSKTAGYEGGVELIIEGGKFENEAGDAIVMANASVSTENASEIEIKGGEITGNVVTYKETKEVDKVEITGGTITEKIDAVVEVKDGEDVRKYSSWEKVIEMEKADGIEIKLLENVDLGAGSEYETGKNCGIIVRNGEELTIDLNGKEIKSAANHSAIYVEAGAKLTIKDSLGGGKITSKGSYCIRNYGELVIDGGEYTVVDGTDTAVESYVLFARTNSTTTINNGTFNGFIGTNGYETITKLTINNGTFNKMLYFAAAGEYEINGGTFEVENNEDNNAVVEVKRGKLTINGGTFQMNVDTSANNNSEVIVDGNGSGAYKAVIIVSKKDGYEGNVNLVINGGEFINTNTNETKDAIIMANESTTLVSDIEITEGEITGDIAYYGLKNGEEGVITNNNITLKGNAATNYNIKLYANKENKGVEDSTTVKTLTGKTYKVTLDAGEGKFSDDSTSKEFEVKNGTKYGDELVNPTKDGYRFDGWYIGETKITSDTIVDLTEDITLTAKYTKKSSGGGGAVPLPKKEYEITVLVGENGTISPNRNVVVKEGENQVFTITPNEDYEIEDVLVNGVSVGAVSTYTFENIKEAGKIEVKFKKIEEVVEKVEYTDVNEEDWYKNAVDYVTEKGLMQGMGNNEFEPKTTTTRAMLVTILYNLEGNPEVDGETVFPDVESDEWYTKAIIWAQKNNIVNGYDDGLFVPKGEVTREQMAVILANYLEYKGIKVEETDELTFEDNNKIADWSREQVKIVKSLKIIQGREDNTYDPKNTATRAEIATVIMNFCENIKIEE